MVLDLIAFGVGAIGLIVGVRSYLELYRWAKQCQGARVAIAYKTKVQLQAPLVEWLMWANQLDRDQASSGRVVYRNRGVSVAILRKVKEPKRFSVLRAIRRIVVTAVTAVTPKRKVDAK